MKYAGSIAAFAITGCIVYTARGMDAATDAGARGAPSETAEGSGEEVEINLDDLEEDETSASKGGLVPDEPMLPVAMTEVALNRKTWLAVVAVVLAVPVALMLLPPRRTRRKRAASSKPDPENKKEA